MKKIIALLLALLMIFCLAACSNEEEEEQKKNNSSSTTEESVTTEHGTFEYGDNGDGDYEITKYIPNPKAKNPADIKLPTTTTPDGDIKIVGIGKEAFKDMLKIKSVSIPDTYTYISDYAFYRCDNLETVTMKDSVTAIGKSAFQECVKLSSITLSKAITTVSSNAFNGCTSLTTVDLSTSCQTIEASAFIGCSNLTTVTISDKITYVNAYAFMDCTKLEYTVENGGKYLGNKNNPHLVLACAEALDIESCIVNDNTKLIADRAFAYCSDLETVTLGKSVKIINGTCFENDPTFDKYFGDEEIPEVKLSFNSWDADQAGCYLGTDENPYMVLMYIIATNNDDFKLHKDTKIIADTAFENSKIKDISFDGSKADWEAISKSENWSHNRTINVIWAEAEEE